MSNDNVLSLFPALGHIAPAAPAYSLTKARSILRQAEELQRIERARQVMAINMRLAAAKAQKARRLQGDAFNSWKTLTDEEAAAYLSGKPIQDVRPSADETYIYEEEEEEEVTLLERTHPAAPKASLINTAIWSYENADTVPYDIEEAVVENAVMEDRR